MKNGVRQPIVLSAVTKTSNPEYRGNIDFCGLQAFVSGRLRFLQNDLNATLEISLQNSFALFVCFLRASERRGKNNYRQLWDFIFDISLLLQTMYMK